MTAYNTRDEVAKLAQEDPDFLKVYGKQFRENPIVGPVDTEHEHTVKIPMRDGYEVETRVHRPPAVATAPVHYGPAPVIVLIHGGGFCLGHWSFMGDDARILGQLYGAAIVCLTYRQAPEHKFPTAHNDVWDALQWVVSHAPLQLKLGVEDGDGSTQEFWRSRPLIVGGGSAGANLAAVTVQNWLSHAREPKIMGVWLSIPYIFEEFCVPAKYKDLWFSREQNADAFVLSTSDITWIKEAYQPYEHSRLWTPFNVEGAHVGYPPVYFQVAGADPLRDDGLVYQKVLHDHGVSTRLDAYPGVPHSYENLFPDLAVAKKNVLDRFKDFGWLLGRELADDEYHAALNS
ncbi:alpha/beta hydrolase fold-3 domain-containing protein [Xylariales sp. PMI_506]|nr:alpha/beta hydrolase fold-3 domain-containing protein [Xylariales sp. PMI_506]